MMFQFRQLMVAAIFLGCVFCKAVASEVSSPHVLVTWLGGPTMTIEFNGVKILTDPTFGEGEKAFSMGDPNEMFDLNKGPSIKLHSRQTRFPGIDVESVSTVLLSHAHEDHFDQQAQARLNLAVPIFLPIADVENIKAKGFKQVDGIEWGATRTLKAGEGKIEITAVNAHHTENLQIEKLLGIGNGYWIEFSQASWQLTMYWTGDSFPTADVIGAIAKLGSPDVLIPHLGSVGSTGPLGQISMGAGDVVKLTRILKPKKILPIHHSTYSLYLEPISRLVEGFNGSKLYGLDLISEGSIVRYE